MFEYVILVASSLGLVVNAAGLWMIGRRRKTRAFAREPFTLFLDRYIPSLLSLLSWAHSRNLSV